MMKEGFQYNITLRTPADPFGTNSWKFCLYQQDPGVFSPNILSLAWLMSPCEYGNTMTINWGIEYAYQWPHTGQLKDGAIFSPFCTFPCVPGDPRKDSTKLEKVDTTYRFMDCDKSPGGDGLLIHCGRNMEQSTAVGMAIDEKSLFAGPACSSKDHLFIPHPTYYVTFDMEDAFLWFHTGQLKDGAIFSPFLLFHAFPATRGEARRS